MSTLNGSLASTWASFKRTGDLAARNALVEHYWPYVCRTVKGTRNGYRRASTLDNMDLSQEAFPLLIRAMDRYDPDRGVPFETFVYLNLSGSVRKAEYRWMFGPNKPDRDAPVKRSMILMVDLREKLETGRNE